MLVLLSLFLICAVVVPPAGEKVRRHHRQARCRRQLNALLRDGPVADYRLG